MYIEEILCDQVRLDALQDISFFFSKQNRQADVLEVLKLETLKLPVFFFGWTT